MPALLPNYETLSENFASPADLSTPDLADELGGKVEWNIENDAKNFGNTCVIRICRALNRSGHLVRPTTGVRMVRDKDGRWYAYSVAEFSAYMRHTFGAPHLPERGPAGAAGKKGIIVFHGSTGGLLGATGHADLWNGAFCRGACYWADAFRVELWEAPAVSTVR